MMLTGGGTERMLVFLVTRKEIFTMLPDGAVAENCEEKFTLPEENRG
jgi:hypothetical protein